MAKGGTSNEHDYSVTLRSDVRQIAIPEREQALDLLQGSVPRKIKKDPYWIQNVREGEERH
jgi:hypothetical protein